MKVREVGVTSARGTGCGRRGAAGGRLYTTRALYFSRRVFRAQSVNRWVERDERQSFPQYPQGGVTTTSPFLMLKAVKANE